MITSGSFNAQRIVDLTPDVKGKTSRSATPDIEPQIDPRRGMNDPEVIMLDAIQGNNLIVYRKAIEAAGDAISLAKRVPAPLRSIADQVIRSASSVPANIAEGDGRFGRDRLHHWRIAYGSAKEVDCHLRLLVGAGAINPNRADATLQLFDEVRAMTWRLLNPKQ